MRAHNVGSGQTNAGLRRWLVLVLPRPPRPDRLPRNMHWLSVLFARVATLLAWGIAMALVYGTIALAIRGAW